MSTQGQPAPAKVSYYPLQNRLIFSANYTLATWENEDDEYPGLDAVDLKDFKSQLEEHIPDLIGEFEDVHRPSFRIELDDVWISSSQTLKAGQYVPVLLVFTVDVVPTKEDLIDLEQSFAESLEFDTGQYVPHPYQLKRQLKGVDRVTFPLQIYVI